MQPRQAPIALLLLGLQLAAAPAAAAAAAAAPAAPAGAVALNEHGSAVVLPSVSQTGPQYQPFVNGVDGWKDYRIPSMLHLANGDLLLFCEARGPDHAVSMARTGDGGPTDIVTRRSTDMGRSWGGISIVHSETTSTKVVTIGNPSPVALKSHPGTIVLTFCRNNRAVAVMNSTDNGISWNTPSYVIEANSTALRKQLAAPADKHVSHIATGPPTSIQLPSGRIIVPTAFCYNGGPGRCSSKAPGDWFAAVMYSDNLGASFSISNKEEGGNECQAAPLSNGSLILNQRTRGPQRQLSYSYNNGATWTEPRPVVLAGTGASTCCGSTVSVGDGHLLVFSGPNSDSRKNMSIYTSTDSGASWESLYQLGDPTLAGGYSSLAAINETHVSIAYEGSHEGHGVLQFETVKVQ